MQNNLTKSELRNKIENLEKYFSKYKKQDPIKKLEEVKAKLNNQEYKIAVVANMSAGKSTFINALFGKEVLPSLNEATTDCATFVYSRTDENKRAVIHQGDKIEELNEDNLEEIKKYALKDESLEKEEIKNKIDLSTYKKVDKIDLYYPFKNIQSNQNEDLNVIFIDTPGPNNTGLSAQKHESITHDVINRVDMLFVIFDLGQLDANLSEGLWNTIKERVEKDKNFIVYFLINKIDVAIEDNFKENNFNRDNWYKKEKEAEETLKQAIKEHKIEKFSIFLISAKLTLLKRDNHIHRLKKQELNSVIEYLKEIFGHESNYEENLIDYMGIEKLENAINSYIHKEAKKNLLQSISLDIQRIIQDEENELTRSEQTLKKPKEEAEKNLEKASEFLENGAKKLEEEMKTASSEMQENEKNKIKQLIDERIEKYFKSKKEEIVYRSIKYIKAYLDSFDLNDAIQSTDKLNFNTIKQEFDNNILTKSSLKLQSLKKINPSDIEKLSIGMNDYMKQKLFECKNSYLNIKSDIKNFYHEFDKGATQLFFTFKEKLEDNIDNELDIQKESIQTHKIELSSIEIIDIEMPESKLSYEYTPAQYRSGKEFWKFWTWFNDDIKVEDEKYYLEIQPKENYENTEKSIESFIKKFYDNELKQHNEKIENHLKTFEDMFQNFRFKKDQEICNLTRDIQEQEKNLEQLNKKILDFQKVSEID